MKTLKFLVLFTTIFSLVLVSGCKKDDDNDPNDNLPEYHVKTVQIPEAMAQSSDPGAQTASAYIGMLNGMAGYGGMMVPPSKSTIVPSLKNGETEIYTWEINEGNTHCTFTLKFTETATLLSWEMIINGTMDGQYFDNFTYIRAEEAKDGSSSTITIYNPETLGVLMYMSWHEQANGTIEFTFEIPQETILTMVVNTDGSGSMELKDWENGHYELVFRVTWDASGHGEWWEYDNGVLSDQGSW